MSEYQDASKIYRSSQMISDLWARVRPYKWKFFFASGIRLVGDIVWLYPSIAAAAILNELAKGADASIHAIEVTFLFLIVAMLVRGISQPVHRLWGYWVSEQAELDTQRNALKHLMSLDMAWHEQGVSGAKVKRVYNAAAGVNRLIRMWFDMLIEIFVNIFGILYILSTVDGTLMYLVGIFIITFFPISFFLGRKAAVTSLEVNKQEEHQSGVMYEAMANVRSIKILEISGEIIARIDTGIRALMQKIFTRVRTYQFKNFVLFFWGQSFHIAGLFLIALGVVSGHYEIGLFVLFNRFFGQIWQSVSELSEFSQEFMTSKLALARLEEVLLIRPEGEDRAIGAMPQAWKEIRFEDVSFSYGSTEALSHITFSLKRGEKIGIVGSSGAGKSTLFKLLLKERATYTGEIYIDDVPLKTIARKAYFEKISAVLQDTEVFNMSLKDNVLMSRVGKEESTVFTEALKTAYVAEFAERLPDGVDTIIGEKGVKLSGGERQRLGIARAIYKQPELLLMDEATSHLDSESEERIRDSLATFLEQVTAVVVAHRLSTIRAMDKILVIEGGSIVEQGTFDELLAKKGRFHELWEKQKL